MACIARHAMSPACHHCYDCFREGPTPARDACKAPDKLSMSQRHLGPVAQPPQAPAAPGSGPAVDPVSGGAPGPVPDAAIPDADAAMGRP